MQRKLGIVAGGGAIPLMVVQACKEKERPFALILLQDFAEEKAFAEIPYKD